MNWEVARGGLLAEKRGDLLLEFLGELEELGVEVLLVVEFWDYFLAVVEEDLVDRHVFLGDCFENFLRDDAAWGLFGVDYLGMRPVRGLGRWL